MQKNKRLTNAVVVSAVGSLSIAKIRMAGASSDAQDVRIYEGAFEIVSLIGTIDKKGQSHLHLSISDKEGVTLGGSFERWLYCAYDCGISACEPG